MTPVDDPRRVLQRLEQRARRRFGQNFLTRVDIVRRIVRGAGISRGDRVVEIGPGLGILTTALLEAGAQLVAVELDRDLARHLRSAFPDLQLVEADALRVDWPELCAGSGWKVVANLPFNVGTRVLLQLVRHPQVFSSVTVMLQKEVVDRMVAPSGSRTYGTLSLQVAARAEVRRVLTVPPSAFHPRPKVEAGVVRLDLYPTPHLGPAGDEAFDRVIRAAFAQRRKTLRNGLGAVYGRQRSLEALLEAGIDPRRRAESLDLEHFQRLAAILHPPGAVD